jgi:hypothetical protein
MSVNAMFVRTSGRLIATDGVADSSAYSISAWVANARVSTIELRARVLTAVMRMRDAISQNQNVL